MSHVLISQPAPSVPLVLRGLGREPTQKQAAGFGSAAGLVDAGALAASLDKAAADLFAAHAAGGRTGAQGRVDTRGTQVVDLRQPDMARVAAAVGQDRADRLDPQAMLALLVGRLRGAMDATGLEGMKTRLAGFQGRMAALISQSEALTAALQAALDEATAAEQGAESAAAEAGTQQGARDAAEKKVKDLQTELDAMAPDDPERAGKQAQLDAAKQRLGAAQARLDQATAALLAATNTFNSALQKVDAQRAVVAANAAQRRGEAPPPDARELSAAATLQKLLAMLGALASDAALDKLKNETESMMATLRAREAENLERARKHEEEVQRARDAEKKTGCAGKILKWVAAAVSVVTLVVGVITLNPALVVAGVVGTLMVADQLAGEHLGFSVMAKLTEGIGIIITGALKAFGVSAELAKTIGTYAAMVVVVALTIVLSIALGNVAGAAQVANTATQAANAAAAVSRMAQAAEVAMQVIQVLGQAAGLAGNITVGVGQIIVAGIMIDVAKLLAAMEDSMFGSEIIRDLIVRIRDAVARLDNIGLDLLRQSAAVHEEYAETSKAIIGAIRGRA